MGEKLTSDKNNRSLVFGAALYASLAIDSNLQHPQTNQSGVDIIP